MTTESKQDAPRGFSPLLAATAASLVIGLVLVLVAWAVDGPAGARGAGAGALITLMTFGWGTSVVDAVSRVMPAASLLIALLTYTLQLLVMGVAVKVVVDASEGGERFAHGWIAAGVVSLGVTWIVAQVWMTVRRRTLAYDLPSSDQQSRTEAGE